MSSYTIDIWASRNFTFITQIPMINIQSVCVFDGGIHKTTVRMDGNRHSASEANKQHQDQMILFTQ